MPNLDTMAMDTDMDTVSDTAEATLITEVTIWERGMLMPILITVMAVTTVV